MTVAKKLMTSLHKAMSEDPEFTLEGMTTAPSLEWTSWKEKKTKMIEFQFVFEYRKEKVRLGAYVYLERQIGESEWCPYAINTYGSSKLNVYKWTIETKDATIEKRIPKIIASLKKELDERIRLNKDREERRQFRERIARIVQEHEIGAVVNSDSSLTISPKNSPQIRISVPKLLSEKGANYISDLRKVISIFEDIRFRYGEGEGTLNDEEKRQNS